MTTAAAAPAFLRLAFFLAAVDAATPGLDAYERAARAYALRDDAVADFEAYDPDEDGSDAYVRHLELQGYDEARFQEEMEARMGIPV